NPMKFKTTRNSRFSKMLCVIAIAGTLFNSCKKDDTVVQPSPAGTVPDSTLTASLAAANASTSVPLWHMFGVNAFAWDFFGSNPGVIDPTKYGLIKSFGQVRHYLD